MKKYIIFITTVIFIQNNLFSQGSVSTGYSNTYFICSDGTVRATGSNWDGEIGDNTTTLRKTPVTVSGLSSITKVSAGYGHTLALKNDSSVWAWGFNVKGQLGDNSTTNRLTPVQVSGLSSAINISANNYTSYALKSDGTVWAWGLNNNGALGNNTTTDSHTPVQVSGLSNITFIGGGGNHCCVLKNDGTVWCWGSNAYGQIGDNSTVNRLTPVQVSGLSNIVSIAGGTNTSYALKNDGTVWAWGRNTFGNIGDNTTVDKYTPVQVSGISNVVAVFGGANHALVIKSDRTGWGWGYNADGELGDGTTVDKLTPVAVGSSISNLSEFGFSSMATSTVALKTNNTVKTWGDGSGGQLGNNSLANRTAPVNPSGLCSVPLPVKLLYFEVDCHLQNEQEQLTFTWTTASETNNNYFTIEMGKALPDKTVVWYEIAQIKSVGNSNQTQKYTYTKATGAEFENTYLYRLKQTDNDGNSTTYNTSEKNCLLKNGSLAVYPNPFSQNVFIYGLPLQQFIHYEIMDVTGQTINYGEQFTSFGKISLNLSQLKKGVYFIYIHTDFRPFIRKIIKME